MSLAQAARELIAAGVTGDALCDALERIEQASSRRSKGAERTARWRERKDAERHAASQNVTVTDDEPSPMVSPKNNNQTPSLTPTEKTPRARACRLPDDFQPTDPDFKTAVDALGWKTATAELAKFRDFWKSKPGAGGTKLDWHATWRNWVRSAVERRPNARGDPAQSGRAFLASVALHGLSTDDQPPDENRLLDITPGSGRSGNGPDDHRALQPAGERPYGGVFDL